MLRNRSFDPLRPLRMTAVSLRNLLLIFTNLSKDNKKKVISEIYDFEKDMGYEVVINRKEVAILNNLIFKKHFKAAILLSDFYQRLYNNVKIKNLYRRFIYK